MKWRPIFLPEGVSITISVVLMTDVGDEICSCQFLRWDIFVSSIPQLFDILQLLKLKCTRNGWYSKCDFCFWNVLGCLLWRWPQSGMVFDIKMNLNIYTVSPPSFLNDSLKIKKLPHRVALSFIHGKATWIVFFGFSFAASCLPSWIVRVSAWIMNNES